MEAPFRSPSLNESIHPQVQITHPDKLIWAEPPIDKQQFIAYLFHVSRYMLPFLENRALTLLRFPHGVPGESFYQKNCPDYAPGFIRTAQIEDTNYIVCQDLSTLLWLGNQLAIEFHIPFNTVGSDKPLEIVFDLDPPSRSEFPLAVKAAKEMKRIFDRLDIKSYPKLSGSRGLQIHIPIYGNTLTYAETRIFTSFIAKILVEKFPDEYTVERLKKNRGSKLYVDYIQHAEGKTIVCPYSTRGKEGATVAAPIHWEEVNQHLKIEKYNVPFVLDRLSHGDCPMSDYFQQNNDSLIPIISSLKEKNLKE
ncbi:ATP-dependent DNA ligase [Sporolactobacillus sp. THM7-7]|nr:ATP-dependent DNA ligase [Sporolactobacillus sp. THM7-7]